MLNQESNQKLLTWNIAKPLAIPPLAFASGSIQKSD